MSTQGIEGVSKFYFRLYYKIHKYSINKHNYTMYNQRPSPKARGCELYKIFKYTRVDNL